MKNLLLLTACAILVLTMRAAYAENPGQTDPSNNNVHSIRLPEVPVVLQAGPGLDKVSTLCNICHSTDYITMQPKFSRAQWTGEVNKMIKVMGAPINEEDAKTIINYLTIAYGTGN